MHIAVGKATPVSTSQHQRLVSSPGSISVPETAKNCNETVNFLISLVPVMIELHPQDRLTHYDDRTFPRALTIIFLVLVVLGAGFFYWYAVWQKPNYNAVYGQLGIAPLPARVELRPNIQSAESARRS